MIRRRKVDTQLERQIIIGMIVSDVFCRKIQKIFKPQYMDLSIANTVCQWCLDYYAKYEKAIGEKIRELFEDWQNESPDEEQVQYIDGLLNNLSDEFEHGDKFNALYLYDKALVYFKKKSYKIMAEEVMSCITNNDLDGAEFAISNFNRVEDAIKNGIDPIGNEDAIRRAFEDAQEPLFKVTGKLGNLINEQLTRDSLVGFMGPEKRGKTWWLMYFAMQAHKSRCNVAFFQVGDMTEQQMIRRMAISLSGVSDRPRYCKNVEMPVMDCINNQEGCCTNKRRQISIDDPRYKPCNECHKNKEKSFRGTVFKVKMGDVTPLTWRSAVRKNREYLKKSRGKFFKLATYPNGEMNVFKIAKQLETWEKEEGFIADVIVIDYADILAPEPKIDIKERHNETWKALRKLSQVKHGCVITATQTNRASYKVKYLQPEHVSEDKRKLAHATAIYALNQLPEEKKQGIMRISPIVVREGDFDVEYNVFVGQSIQTGRPYLFSF